MLDHEGSNKNVRILNKSFFSQPFTQHAQHKQQNLLLRHHDNKQEYASARKVLGDKPFDQIHEPFHLICVILRRNRPRSRLRGSIGSSCAWDCTVVSWAVSTLTPFHSLYSSPTNVPKLFWNLCWNLQTNWQTNRPTNIPIPKHENIKRVIFTWMVIFLVPLCRTF